MAIIDKITLPNTKLSKLNENDMRTIILGTWLVSAIMLVFSNRYILIDLKFAYPITLVVWQAFTVLLVTRGLLLQMKLSRAESSTSPEEDVSSETYFSYLLPIGVFLGLGPLWATIASKSLSLWQMALLQGITPLLAAAFSKFLGSRISGSKIAHIVLIVVLLLIATIGGIKFGKYDTELTDKQLYGAAWTGNERILQQDQSSKSLQGSIMSPEEILGISNATTVHQTPQAVQTSNLVNMVVALFCGLFAVASEAGSKVLMENVLKAREDRISPSQLLLHVTPAWFVVSAISAAVVEKPDLSLFASLPLGILFVNAIAAVMLAYTIPAVVQISSATTYVLADTFRQTLVTFLACVIYNIPIGIMHAISFFAGLVSFAKYVEKEIPQDVCKRPSDYAMHPVATEEDLPDTEANSPSSTEFDVDVSGQASTSINMFIVLCGFLLAVLVMASMTTRPILSPAQAITYEQSVVVPYEQSKVATIIETRNLPHLGPLILQFITVLPPDWPVIAWCSPENIEVMRQIPAIARNVETGRLDLRLFPHQFDIHNQEYLSRFLTKPWFWETMQQEYILFFQSDSILCSKSPQKIDDWLGFDWVGAPWADSPDAHGGNGGLSLRKRSSMIKLTRNPAIAREDWGQPEDVWFSQRLEELPGVRWPVEHQAKFSVENIFGSMSEWAWRPLGCHSGGNPPPTWRTEDIMNRLMDWCPELKLFYDPRAVGS